MDATAIVERLKASFNDNIRELVTDNPDPYVVVDAAALADICRFLKTDPEIELDFLESVAGLDMGDKLLVVYHLLSYRHRHSLVVKVETSADNPEVPSIAAVWAAADWHEREQYDLFGIRFSGHPDLRRLLLPEDWVGHPLRKGYQAPEHYHGISHARANPLDQYKRLDLSRAPAPTDEGGQESGPAGGAKSERVAPVTENAGA